MGRELLQGRALPLADQLQLSRQEVDAGIALGAEHAQAAFHLQAGAAGGDGGLGAAGKPQPGIGDVHPVRLHRGPHRLHILHCAAGQRDDEVEVMDHQIQHHGDIQPARPEGRDPHRLHIKWPADPGGGEQGGEAGPEALHMTDLDDLACLGGQGHQGIGLFQRRRDGLLHEDVLAGLQHGRGQLEVEGGGRGDDQRIGGGDQLRRLPDARTGLRGYLGGALGAGIGQAEELDLAFGSRLGGLQRVEAAEMPCPQNPQLQPHAPAPSTSL
jgi:hypothetical protein